MSVARFTCHVKCWQTFCVMSAMTSLALAPAAAQTDSYPNKPISIVVGYPRRQR